MAQIFQSFNKAAVLPRRTGARLSIGTSVQSTVASDDSDDSDESTHSSISMQSGRSHSLAPRSTTNDFMAISSIAENRYTARDIMRMLLPVWQGTPEQLEPLLAMTYANNVPILNAEKRGVIIEVVGMLRGSGYDVTLQFCQGIANLDFLLWEQPAMDESRARVNRELLIHQNQEEGVEGVAKCRFCPSTRVVWARKQTSGGDEATTIFVRCVQCGKGWRES